MINIIFFSKYREQMGLSSLQLDLKAVATVAELIRQLGQQYPTKTGFLADQKLLIAVNQEIATTQTPLKAGDEVAFFPPVTGG